MMKKLLLSVVLGAFAVAAQAGDDATCSEKAGSCCSAAKVSSQAKAECTMAKQAKANKGVKQASARQILKSPKAMG